MKSIQVQVSGLLAGMIWAGFGVASGVAFLLQHWGDITMQPETWLLATTAITAGSYAVFKVACRLDPDDRNTLLLILALHLSGIGLRSFSLWALRKIGMPNLPSESLEGLWMFLGGVGIALVSVVLVQIRQGNAKAADGANAQAQAES